MANTGSILLLDDERDLLSSLEKYLKKKGYFIRSYDDGKQVLKFLKTNPPVDVILSDIRMPAMDGIEFLKQLKKIPMAPPIIMMTAYGSIRNAVEALKAGAYDYLTKPFEMDELLLSIQRAIELVSLRKEVQRLRNTMMRKYSMNGLAAKSKIMQSVLAIVQRMAKEKTPILFIGSSGTGKKFLSQVIHQTGDRSDKPFEIIASSAVPEGMQKMLLFGDAKNQGYFQKAENGTLLIEDIDTLTQECQLLLLHYLESGEFTFEENSQPAKSEVRILAAMKGTAEEVKENPSIRQDLFYKLSPFMIALPDLKNRREDIPLLAQSFLEAFCSENNILEKKISTDAMKVLMNYSWPGNVRELQNVIERAMILSTDDTIATEDLPQQMTSLAQIDPAQLPSNFSLLELEKAYIYQVLQENNNHQGNSAKALGIDRKALYRKIRVYYPELSNK